MTNVQKFRKPAPGDGQAPEIRRLSSLLDVSQALSGTLNLKSAMHNVLEILARHHGAVRGIITMATTRRRRATRSWRSTPTTRRVCCTGSAA